MERVKFPFNLQVPSDLVAHVLNSFSSSAANRKEESLERQRRAAIWHRPRGASRKQGRGLPIRCPNQGQLRREAHASKRKSRGQVSTSVLQ